METLKFDEIKIGDVVLVHDTYGSTLEKARIAVGIVKEKRETETEKWVCLQFGFKDEDADLKPYVVEYKVKPRGEQTIFVIRNLGNVLK